MLNLQAKNVPLLSSVLSGFLFDLVYRVIYGGKWQVASDRDSNVSDLAISL